MRGAVAAGNRHTADAGAWALATGGNAVDAVAAAAFAAFVAEGPLTGPAGGGFLLLRDAGGEPTLLDCFFGVPSRPRGAMDEVVIDFGDASTQLFHVGPASVAVPGLVAGLAEAHEQHGRLPWAALFEPALDLARMGVETSGPQRFLLEILVPILERTPEGHAIYGAHARIETRSMVPGLELLRDEGRNAVAQIVPELAEDIASYRVAERAPLEMSFAGARVLSCPPPSRGGRIVESGLAAIEELEARPGARPPLAVVLAEGLLAGYGGPTRHTALTGTTHISVIDGDGAAAALSSTLGSGSGVFAGGFQLNNMLGELDVIGTHPKAPGERLASMMTPTLVLEDGRPRLALGSAGSVRLAGAIVQVIEAVVGRGEPVHDAIAAPRIHVEGDGPVHLEGGRPDSDAVELADAGREVVRWAGRNLFFGGVAAVERRADGSLEAAGDPRRGGDGQVVA